VGLVRGLVDALPAGLGLAGAAATVAIVPVAVVALLACLGVVIAALQPTEALARRVIRHHRGAFVAGLEREQAVATVAGAPVAFVALRPQLLVQDTVAARQHAAAGVVACDGADVPGLDLARAAATIAASGVGVVALLAALLLHDTIAAGQIAVAVGVAIVLLA